MKTLKQNKLVFGKNDLIELNDHQISEIVGGSNLTIDAIKLIIEVFTIPDLFDW